ncbi:hypothetical protein HU230_0008895 [Bradyrhizobium quebecense]|uniref:Uncharacterized protein n=1 Tax=Bradyrhizobium quebecense TaxID=2748629 RepID=A0A973WRH2_9BRAD|nr:hypothetical protein [Bradyrhizobium quebecense]UGA46134.1 hypothetical protein HU230_0008895 [Bradyrhizobium quebecense]
MNSNIVAIALDGVWMLANQAATKTNSGNGSNVVEFDGTNDVDRIVGHLGQVVRLARNLSEGDARRVRAFVHAASSALLATTYLPKSDQALFEHSLRK